MLALPPVLWLVCATALSGYAKVRAVRLTKFEVAALATASTGVVGYLALPALSIGRILSATSDAIWWSAWIAISLALGARYLRTGVRELSTAAQRWLRAIPQRGVGWWIWALSVGAISALALASALLYPPLTWDSLAHHMPRVFQIIQNRTVAFFPTFYPTMNTTYPFVAYQIVHIKLLGGSMLSSVFTDFGVNAVQWPALLLGAAGVYSISRKLTVSRAGSRVAVLAMMSTVPVVLQATAEMYDLTIGLWLVLAVYLTVTLIGESRLNPSGKGSEARRRILLIGLGLCAGLGVLTKITWLLFFYPFGLWLAVVGQRRWGWRRALASAGMVAALAAVVASPWLGMNAFTQRGDALLVNVPGNQHVLASVRTPSALWANAVRNLGAQLGVPSAEGNAWTVERIIAPVAGVFGTDVNADSNKENAYYDYALSPEVTDPEVAGGPLSAVLFALAGLAALVAVWSQRGAGLGHITRRITLTAYVTCTAVGLFTVAALVTWQALVTRTLGPGLMVFTPIVGFAIDQMRATNWSTAFTRTAAAATRALMVGVLSVAVCWALFAVTFSYMQRLADPAIWTRFVPRFTAAVLCTDADLVYSGATRETGALQLVPAEWVARAGAPVALIGGNNALLQPLYPVVVALQERGMSVYFDTSYRTGTHLFKPGEHLEVIDLPDDNPTLVMSYDFSERRGSALIDGTPVSQTGAYTLIWEDDRGDGTLVTLWLKGAPEQ